MSEVEQIDIATVEDTLFQPHVDTEFTIRYKPEAVEGEDPPVEEVLPITLMDVAKYPDHRDEDERHNQARKPFGLVFKCGAVISQGIYRLEHAELPPVELFVTPIDGGEDWCKFEAVIN